MVVYDSRCSFDFDPLGEKEGLDVHLLIDGGEVICELGVETSDYDAFFSLAPNRNRCRVLSSHVERLPGQVTRQIDVEMPQARWRARERIEISSSSCSRDLELLPLQICKMQDFVVRFAFPKASQFTAEIAGHRYPHKATNVWYQYPVDEAALTDGKRRLVMRRQAWSGEKYFSAETYVRDEPPDRWIVHFRLVPAGDMEYWIIWPTRHGRILDLRGRPAEIILRNGWLRNKVWNLSERRGGRLQFRGTGVASVPAGERLAQSVTCHLLRE